MIVIPRLLEAVEDTLLKSERVTKSSSRISITSFSMSSLLAPGHTEATYTWGIFISLTNSTFVVKIAKIPKKAKAMRIMPMTTG